ncbi:MAG: signal peptidase [Jatrophihabitans sp.]|nr:signal peptidase [Jatrophihabitans sp.]
MLAVGAVVAGADQLSKSLVLATHAGTRPGSGGGWISIVLARNHGASTGIGADHPLIVTGIEIVAIGFVTALALGTRNRVVAISLALVLGGALGNLLDRFVRAPGLGRGAVVDWIHFGGRGGSLDVADVAIQLGAIVALAATFVGSRRPHPARAGRPAPNSGS